MESEHVVSMNVRNKKAAIFVNHFYILSSTKHNIHFWYAATLRYVRQ